MPELTEEFIEQAFRREQDPLAQLITIRSDAEPEPIRVTDWLEGMVSDGVAYPHYPFRLTWAGASQENPYGEGRLAIANVDRRIEEACDASNDPPEVDLSLVRVDTPDVVEKAIVGARIPSVEGDAREVTALVRPRDFEREPVCSKGYTPALTPGLF